MQIKTTNKALISSTGVQIKQNADKHIIDTSNMPMSKNIAPFGIIIRRRKIKVQLQRPLASASDYSLVFTHTKELSTYRQVIPLETHTLRKPLERMMNDVA